MDLSSLQSLTYGAGSGQWVKTIEADAGGTINLSGLETIAVTTGQDDILDFRYTSGGQIDLSGLRLIDRNGNGNERVRFFFEPGQTYTLGALERADRTEWNLGQGTTLNLPVLTVMDSENRGLSLDVNATLNMPQLTGLVSTVLSLGGGSELNAPNVTDFTNSQVTIGQNATFNTGVLNQIDHARLAVSGGESFGSISDTGYTNTRTGHETIFSASGTGSELDLSSLQSLTYGRTSGQWVKTIEADAGGTINLSGLETIAVTTGQDDILDFRYTSGGQIDLSGLRLIDRNGNGNERVRFFFEPGQTYTLGALERADRTEWNLGQGTTLNLPVLTVMDSENRGLSLDVNATLNMPQLTGLVSTVLSLGGGSELNAPNVTDFTNSQVTIGQNATFNTGVLNQIDHARLAVSGGESFGSISDTGYTNTRTGHETIFSASGTGSELDLSSLQSLTYGRTSGQWVKTIEADAGGTINLSGLETIAVTTGQDDILDFRYTSGGQIDLSGLRLIDRNGNGNERVRFFFEPGQTYTLGALERADRTEWNLGQGTTLNLPVLTVMDSENRGLSLDVNATLNMPQLTGLVSTVLSLGGGSELNAPNVTDFTNSQVTIGQNATFNTGVLNQIDHARLAVSGGESFGSISDTGYTNTRQVSETIFSASGSNSELDLSSLESLTYGPGGGRWVKTIEADAGGTINLSGLETIAVNPGQDDILDIRGTAGGLVDLTGLQSIDLRGNGNDRVRFFATGGGQIALGSIQIGSRTEISVTGLGSILSTVKDLTLDATGTIAVENGGEVRVGGHFSLKQTDEARFNIDQAILRMDGVGGQFFEAGGEDQGADGFTSGNFGIGQLVVGRTEQRTSVELLDVVDNGNRGTTGKEALYLYGLGGPGGLRILNDSALILNGINVYAWDAAQADMVHLNSLFGPNELRVAYDDGYLQLVPLTFQWDNPSGGDFNVPGNWNDNLVPLASDAALWNLGIASGYTMQIGQNVATDSVIVKNDNVTFDLNGFRYTAAGEHATTAIVVGQSDSDQGRLTVLDGTLSGASMRIAAVVGAQGRVTVGSGGTVQIDEQLILGEGDAVLSVQTSGKVVVDGVLDLGVDGLLDLQGGGVTVGQGAVQMDGDRLQVHAGGVVKGGGVITGHVTNHGTVEVGGSEIGRLEITRSWSQGSSGELAIKVGVEHDVIEINGSADLAGNLAVNIANGFTPDIEDTFEIANYGSRTGVFTTVTGHIINNNLALGTMYTDDALFLVATAPGDANFDFKVDAEDLNELALSWQQSGRAWQSGDFNGDGMVDAEDLNLLANNWQFGVGQPGSLSFKSAWADALANAAIPEPVSGLVWAVGMGCLSLGRRRIKPCNHTTIMR